MFSRWVTLVVSIYMMLVGGTLYSYPAWSPSLKTSLDYNTSELNFIGVCVNAGMAPLHLAPSCCMASK